MASNFRWEERTCNNFKCHSHWHIEITHHAKNILCEGDHAFDKIEHQKKLQLAALHLTVTCKSKKEWTN
jgi:hypothetical protein